MSAIVNEDEGHVRVLTLDRPQARNAVDPATAAALREAFEAFEMDDEAVLDQWSLDMPGALRHEALLGDRSLESEGRDGARRFAAVAGRKGHP